MRGMISSVSAAGIASNTIAKQPASWSAERVVHAPASARSAVRPCER